MARTKVTVVHQNTLDDGTVYQLREDGTIRIALSRPMRISETAIRDGKTVIYLEP
jgi:hypothetical protein